MGRIQVGVGILTDLTKCIGCRACVLACKEINGLPRDDGGGELSATTWTKLDRYRFPDRPPVHVRRHCMHCLDPACVSVCPVAALHKSAENAVIYDAGRCIGCRYCMIGCPFGIPKYEWGKALPFVRKCIFCFQERLQHGTQPACTEVCPTGATLFGQRDDLIEEARRRLRRQPEAYVQTIFGLKEAGGTSVLYLSAVPFEKLGFPTGVKFDPYPRFTWEILSKLPKVVTVGGAVLFGIAWIVRRRDLLAQNKKAVAAPPGPEGKDSPPC